MAENEIKNDETDIEFRMTTILKKNEIKYTNQLADIENNLLTEYQKSIIDKMAKELRKPRERVSIYGRRRRPRR